MSVNFIQNTVPVKMTFNPDGSVGCEVDPPNPNAGKVLPLHYSIIGEVEPALAPLSIDYSISPDHSYRYDWVVGIGAPPIDWNYREELRRERAITVQLVINCNDSGVSFSDSSPMLLGLQPSLHTSSWRDRNAAANRDSVKQVAQIAQPYVPVLPGVLEIASNYIGSSDDKDNKNWWMYRFFEKEFNCTVIEWNVNNKVLVEYGPLLRGSVVLSFHGDIQESGYITLLLRPRLGFDKRSGQEVNFVPENKDLERGHRVALEVRPRK